MFLSNEAFIKMGKYQEAIRDCEWALEVSHSYLCATFDTLFCYLMLLLLFCQLFVGSTGLMEKKIIIDEYKLIHHMYRGQKQVFVCRNSSRCDH